MRSLVVGLWIVAFYASVALSAAADETTFVDAARVSDAFARGAPLLETETYKIHASRRETPGMAEIHEQDTDILYVLEGTATLVTGGELVEGKTTAAGEIRGTSIRGGEARSLAPGDVLIVPNGTAHWFREVEAPFLYFVVKVTTNKESL